jgi:hypothetical protein
MNHQEFDTFFPRECSGRAVEARMKAIMRDSPQDRGVPQDNVKVWRVLSAAAGY